jgi:folate-dependent phosphoribosylglycinamide formyltransferase PurN
MKKLSKVVIICPNPKSLYTTAVCELLQREGIQIQAVFVKKFTFMRFKDEFARDGKRLLKKIWRKLILRNKSYSQFNNIENILKYRIDKNIELKDVRELENKGIPIFFVQDLNSEKVEGKFKDLSPDLVVFTGGGMIRENILKNSGAGIFNCHMGILPQYRGMDVVEWPILNNDFNNIGLTVHFMEKGVDTGAILLKHYINIQRHDNIKTLRIRFEPLMVECMVKTVVDFLNGHIKPEKQCIDDGKQYFVMHPQLEKCAEGKLINYSKTL